LATANASSYRDDEARHPDGNPISQSYQPRPSHDGRDFQAVKQTAALLQASRTWQVGSLELSIERGPIGGRSGGGIATTDGPHDAARRSSITPPKRAFMDARHTDFGAT
jgi:hypothetical protein